MKRAKRVDAGAGDPAIVKRFYQAEFRFWAGLPAGVDAVMFLGNPGKGEKRPGLKANAEDQIIAVVKRPVFPKGVCTGCGCSERDACVVDSQENFGIPIGCSWIDATKTRCSACGPAPTIAMAPRKARKR